LKAIKNCLKTKAIKTVRKTQAVGTGTLCDTQNKMAEECNKKNCKEKQSNQNCKDKPAW
jgi:hypothetical protein